MSRGRIAALGLALGVPAVALGGLLVAPALLHDDLLARLDAEIAAQTTAKVGHGDLQIDLLSAFPTATLTVRDVTVDNAAPFDGVRLAAIDEVRVGVDLWSLVAGGDPQIREVTVLHPVLDIRVDDQGRMNTDIAVPTPETTEAQPSSAYAIDLNAVRIQDLDLSYRDRAGGTELTLRDLDHHLTGRATDAGLAVDTRTTIAALGLTSGGVRLLKDAALALDLRGAYAYDTGEITLAENRLTVNALSLAAEGRVRPGEDDVTLNLKVHAPEAGFRELLSLVPDAYGPAFAGVAAQGTLGFTAEADGRYSFVDDVLPKLKLALSVDGASFRYPDLPVGVDQIAADVRVEHPGGPSDLAVIDVQRLHLAVDGGPLDVKGQIRTPVSDPDVDLTLKAALDLGQLAAALPADGPRTEGRLDADLQLAGRSSAFEASAFDQVRADGFLRSSGLVVPSDSLPAPARLSALDLAFSPQRVDVRALTGVIGDSDFDLTGTVDNVVPWWFAEKPLVGRFDLHSKRLDLDALLADDASATPTADDAASGPAIATVPTDLDVEIALRAESLVYSGLTFDDAAGTLQVADGVASLQGLSVGMFGGRVGIDGTYAAPTVERADLDFALNVQDVDLTQASQAFTTLARVLPAAEAAKGRFDSLLSLQARLGPDGAIELPTLRSRGQVSGRSVEARPDALSRVATELSDPALGRFALGDGTVLYELLDGKLQVKPSTVLLGATPATLAGSADVLGQSMDLGLDLTVPTGRLSAAVLGASAAALPAEAPVTVALVGPWSDPKLTVRLTDAKAAAVDAVKAQIDGAVSDAVAKASALGDDLLAKAEAEAKRLTAEAKKAADALRREAKAQGDKLVADAKGNPLKEAAAKEARKKLVDEAEKKATRLESEARKKGDAAIGAAEAKKSELVRAAGG